MAYGYDITVRLHFNEHDNEEYFVEELVSKLEKLKEQFKDDLYIKIKDDKEIKILDVDSEDLRDRIKRLLSD